MSGGNPATDLVGQGVAPEAQGYIKPSDWIYPVSGEMAETFIHS